MRLVTESDKAALGRRAASDGARLIRESIRQRGAANIIVATGASQLEMLEALVAAPDIGWNRITAFHLDEYIGLPITHPASFRKYLWERFHRKLPLPLSAFHYIDPDANDPASERRRLAELIGDCPIDVAFVGIGENAHLAFNDPPADFEAKDPYLLVNLDQACRAQQLGEGWFSSLEEVPRQAISMSCGQILQSSSIICSVPDQRKAKAVRDSIKGPVTNRVPASILQRHADVTIYLDPPSASLL